MNGWSKIVKVNDDGMVEVAGTESQSTEHDVDSIIGDDKDEKSATYDLTSPREWLEFCEHRLGYPGAYTVMRCDFSLNQQQESGPWILWGSDFHMSRLQKSFISLLETIQQHQHSDGRLKPWIPTEDEIRIARTNTETAVSMLLSDAERAIGKTDFDIDCDSEDDPILVMMVTILWEPRFDVTFDGINGIEVRGHAFSTLRVSTSRPVTNPNSEVDVVVGHLPTRNLESTDGIEALPNRHQFVPDSKLSSWCRRRRTLERLFHRPGNGDIILTKVNHINDASQDDGAGTAAHQKIELLEGLTSNLFVVYKDKVIRTPPSSVALGGYARQLVMDVAEQCGYRVEVGHVFLEESSSWNEVFLTSSIRLIVPVQRLLLFSDHTTSDSRSSMQFDTIWERSVTKNDYDNDDSDTQLAHHKLYREICRQRRDYSKFSISRGLLSKSLNEQAYEEELSQEQRLHPIGKAKIDYSTASEYVQEHYGIPNYFGRSDNDDSKGTISSTREEHVFDARSGVLEYDNSSSNNASTNLNASLRPAELDSCGFQIFRAPTKVQNFFDMNDVRLHYVKELTETLIPHALGIDIDDAMNEIESITLWHPVLRGEDLSIEPGLDGRPSMGPVASKAHIDTDVGAYGLEGLCILVDKNRVESIESVVGGESERNDCNKPATSTVTTSIGVKDELMTACNSGCRVILLNIWRPLVPVTSAPLGILATRYDPTLPPERSFFPLAAPDTRSTSHWYIFSDMRPDECLIFKQFDRRLDKRSDLWHCALTDLTMTHCNDDEKLMPNYSTNKPRRSFDIKAMVILKEKVPSHLDRLEVAQRPELTLEESGEFCNSQARRLKLERDRIL